MEFLSARTLEEALESRAATPGTVPIAGGTDLMVELNFDRHRPEAILDVSAVPELARWRRENGSVFLGAGVTYARVMRELPELVPLVQASRTVGSPQIRNRATGGGVRRRGAGTGGRMGRPVGSSGGRCRGRVRRAGGRRRPSHRRREGKRGVPPPRLRGAGPPGAVVGPGRPAGRGCGRLMRG